MDSMTKKLVFKDFGKYVSVNMLAMFAVSLYILADTFFIARGIGSNGLVALNLVLPMFTLMNAVGMMIGMGGGTKFALLGEENVDARKKVFTHSMVLAILFGIVFALIGIFAHNQIATLLGADEISHPMTSEYLFVLYCFAPAFVLNHSLLAFVRNDGSPKLAMAGAFTSSFSNIILDYIFIFPCQMGIFGGVLATGIACCLSVLVLSTHFFKKSNNLKLKFSKPEKKYIGSIFSLGIFAFITEMSGGLSILIFNFLILKISGNVGVAAYGVIANVALVFGCVFNGIAQGIQPLVSGRIVKNKKEEVRFILMLAIVLSILIGLLSYVFLSLCSTPIIQLFNLEKNAELLGIAKIGFYIYFVALAFMGINIVGAGFFSAIGDVKKSFVISILRGFVLLGALAVIFAYSFGIMGVWSAVPTTEILVSILVGIFVYLYVKKEKKREKTVFENGNLPQNFGDNNKSVNDKVDNNKCVNGNALNDNGVKEKSANDNLDEEIDKPNLSK